MQDNNRPKEANKELVILQCAEEVFLERGFDGAKTTEIARRAGVNHAMLHYYFRTKENLFNVVFQNKIGTLAASFVNVFAQDLPFLDKIRVAIETHFDFIAKNPKLIFFIYSEIVNNDERKLFLIKSMIPKLQGVIQNLETSMEDEVTKGNVRKINPIELIMNIVSLNVTTFLAYPIVEIYMGSKEKIDELLLARKESNVNFIINSIKIEKSRPQYTQTSLDFGF